MFGHIYEGRRVFVTGHTGFKGSWLTAWLLQMGAEVAGFSDAVPTAPSHFDVIGLGGRIRDYRGDVRDRKALVEAMREFKPEIVFHLAAQALVRASYDNPADTIEVNAMGTLNVLEAVRVTPSVEAVVSITSDKAYRNDEWVWGYRETDHLGGYDPYSASKGCAEIIAHSYFKSFFGDPVNAPYCATTRAGNVIGGGDWAADRIVPDCARAWSEGREVEIRSPHATRPWQHVLEPLSGYLWLGAKLFAAHRDAVKAGKGDGCHEGFRLDGEAFNFGRIICMTGPPSVGMTARSSNSTSLITDSIGTPRQPQRGGLAAVILNLRLRERVNVRALFPVKHFVPLGGEPHGRVEIQRGAPVEAAEDCPV